MSSILHRIGVEGATTTDVYDALTTIDGLAGWWTEDVSGDGTAGGRLEVRFPPVGGFDMEVLETVPSESVRWRVVEGPDEWVGTTITWSLRQEGDYAIVMFSHDGWREQVPFMNHCSTKWAVFLLSLKALIESGKGTPAPRDVAVSDWH